MLWFNHLVGGSVLTGLTYALVNGENLLATKTGIACSLVFSLLPDIDLPQSPISKLTLNKYFRHSNYLVRKFGHRTITHSWLALLLVFVFTKILSLFTPVSSAICCYAFSWHLIMDMMTVDGVPFGYPRSLKKWVLPGNPRFRFKTSNSTEFGILGFSLMLGVFCYPLAQQGFWTTYNVSFANQRTLHSEFVKARDLLSVTYSYNLGNELKTGNGLVIDAKEAETVLYENSRFHIIADGKNGTVVKSMEFQHTGKTFKFETLNFITISADSLNRLVFDKAIASIEVLANNKAQITEGGINSDFSSYKSDWKTGLIFSAKDSSYTPRPFQYVASAAAKLKRNQIQGIRDEYQLKLNQYNQNQSELQNLIASNEADALKREAVMERIKKLKSEQAPVLDMIQIRQLEFEAQVAESQDALQIDLRRMEHERQEREKAAKVTQTHFSGFIKYIKFD